MSSSSRSPYAFEDTVKPSIRWYGVALLVILAGLGFLYNFAMTGFDRINDALIQIQTPATVELMLGKKGEHGVYLETATLFDGKPYVAALDDADGLAVTVVRKADDAVLPLTDVKGNAAYSLFGREGAALFMFKVEETGAYIVTVGESPQGKEKPLVVAVSGLNPNYEMTGMLADGSLIFLMIWAVTIACWATVFLLRKKNREKDKWGNRVSKKGEAPTKPTGPKTPAAPNDPNTIVDLRPNGKKKKRKK